MLRAAQSLDQSLGGSLLDPARAVYVRSPGSFKLRCVCANAGLVNYSVSDRHPAVVVWQTSSSRIGRFCVVLNKRTCEV